MNPLKLADDDPDDPIVWQCGKLVPTSQGSARVLVYVMRRSDEERLLRTFGRAWLDAHLRELTDEVDKWGVH